MTRNRRSNKINFKKYHFSVAISNEISIMHWYFGACVFQFSTTIDGMRKLFASLTQLKECYIFFLSCLVLKRHPQCKNQYLRNIYLLYQYKIVLLTNNKDYISWYFYSKMASIRFEYCFINYLLIPPTLEAINNLINYWWVMEEYVK